MHTMNTMNTNAKSKTRHPNVVLMFISSLTPLNLLKSLLYGINKLIELIAKANLSFDHCKYLNDFVVLE